MKTVKNTIVFILLIVMIASVPLISSAHEWSGTPRRWHDVIWNQSLQHNQVHVYYNDDCVYNVGWVYDDLQDALSDWASGSSYITFEYEADPSLADLIITTESTPPDSQRAGDTGHSVYTNNGYLVCVSSIVNLYEENMGSLTSYQIRKICAHEIGHVLGLGDTPSDIQSIMRQGGVDYWTPQTHDINDVASYYSSTPWL